MVDIAIDHRDLPGHAFLDHEAGGDSDIVEHAEACPALIVRMVAAPGETDRGAMLHRQPRSETRPANRGARPGGDGGCHLEADTPLPSPVDR